MLSRVSRCISGLATIEGTSRFAKRNFKVSHYNFNRTYQTNLLVSNIGIGTYLGDLEPETDLAVQKAIVEVVSQGCVNMIDTALNYRYMKAERAVGRAISQLVDKEGIARDEFVLASKVGLVTDDFDNKVTGAYQAAELIKSGAISKEDITDGSCIHPAFLQDQLNRSLENLGVENLDVLYLHNAPEVQLKQISSDKFQERLGIALEWLETQKKEGKIGAYGLANWATFRKSPEDTGSYINLEKVKAMAPGMDYIQVPWNIMMPEALIYKYQTLNGEPEYLFNVTKELEINVVISQPLLQGRLAYAQLRKSSMGCDPPGARVLQLTRSIPSESVKSVVVGMKNPRNIVMNLQACYIDPLVDELFWDTLNPEGKEHPLLSVDL